MPANLIDGKAIAEQINAETIAEIARLKDQRRLTPGLAVILVGENPASSTYVSMKDKMCARLGLHSERVNLPASASEGELLAIITDLNFKREIHGILVQSPLPPQISEEKVFATVDPTKDVDGFHPLNIGKLALGDPTGFAPCTPAGVHQLLIRSGVTIDGAHVVVLGRSRIVGRPISLMLSQKAPHANATVTVCHSRSANLTEIVRSADILIAAIGVPRFVKADMVRDGTVVIDVGINRIDDKTAEKGHSIVGDVDFEAVMPKAALITPVPGGVGPMTIAMLMHNTVRAVGMRHGIA
ncbi:MAG TPA: bifunctional 5,10-methylenetetrahydrofolate dehydrogenase/5,10-methenyltetrahydrofolate cyclohydrolase [Verrucomicrobiae bacterium]|nr:bifunctional 5,10-methylenetetrahydrofolate dehydrogenase/5,10-methenyltetrahydrofolate cyclohydrolase [Verrucomicrobiae bacterium]